MPVACLIVSSCSGVFWMSVFQRQGNMFSSFYPVQTSFVLVSQIHVKEKKEEKKDVVFCHISLSSPFSFNFL